MNPGELYRDIVETSRDGIWLFDLHGRTVYANPQMARLFGVPESEMAGLTVFDSLDEIGREQFAGHLDDLRAGTLNDTEVECMFVRRDGSRLWVLVRESGFYAPDGTLTSILHRVTDYSDRRRTLHELRTSQRRLSEAQRIAQIGGWDWDVERDEITGSPELCDLYGYDQEHFPVTYAQFLETVHPEDRKTVDRAVRSVREGNLDFAFTARVMGGTDWVWTRGRGVGQRDADGRLVSMSGTHQDVTETKQAELALEDSVAQNTIMQAVASAANEATSLEEVLAQARPLVLLHDDWERARAFVPSADGQAVVPLYVTDEDREADDETPTISAMELALANDAFRRCGSLWDESRLTIASPVGYGGTICAIVTVTSAPPLYRHAMIESMVEHMTFQLGRVAERENAARELARARDAAMEASRQKSEFLATMSHEIRTPLNGVIGLNDLLLRTDLDAEQTRYASGLRVASRALLSVINEVLDFSRIEAGRLELEKVDFEVRPVFEQVANVLAGTARAKGLDLVVSCHPDVPEVLAGDPTRLAQILANLGSNAVKFTDSGSVTIRATVQAGPASEPDDRPDHGLVLRVEVIDTGIGIKESERGSLFEPFTQADSSTTRIHGGTGLGLAISREIVRALGGEIGIETNPTGGTIFWFTARLDQAAGSGGDPDDQHARSLLACRRILVVGDQRHTGLVLAEQLSWWKVLPETVTGAAGARAALAQAAAQGEPFEAVLLDLDSVDAAIELAREIDCSSAYAPTILMLSPDSSPDRPLLAKAGVSSCLTRPVLPSALRSALLEHVVGVGPRPEARSTARESSSTGHRVLVVEDNPVNQLVAVGLLEVFGYSAVTADDGILALEELAHDSYDIILMDVQMPRLDGYAATRQIRAQEGPDQRVPIIAMTAAAVEGERERCLAAGMDDFLTKPVDPTSLEHTLNKWLQKEPSMVLPPNSATPTPPDPQPDQDLDERRIGELRDLDPGDTTYLDRAIGNFVKNTPTTMVSIRSAYDEGDAATLKSVTHKLAGGALNLGVTRAGRIAQQLELAVDDGSVDGAEPLIEDLDAALARGRAAVLAYQAEYQAAQRADLTT